MSLCDTCPQPGHCCRAISLGGGSFAKECETTEEAQAFIDAQNLSNAGASGGIAIPMPFRPLFKRATDGIWMWWCPNLNPRTGRCDDYDNRPFACRDYQPGTDGLCVLHEPEKST